MTWKHKVVVVVEHEIGKDFETEINEAIRMVEDDACDVVDVKLCQSLDPDDGLLRMTALVIAEEERGDDE